MGGREVTRGRLPIAGMTPEDLAEIRLIVRLHLAEAEERILAELQRKPARPEGRGFGAHEYRLGRGHKAFHLVYRGQQEVLKEERAVVLVEYLLKHPPEEGIHASVWESLVDGVPVRDPVGAVERVGVDGECSAGLGGVIQEATGRKLQGRITLPELKAKLAQLHADMGNETLPPSAREEARQERRELLRAHERGGTMTDGASQAAERVRKAIRVLIRELKEAEVTSGTPNMVLREFGQHLERYLWLPSVGAWGRKGASCRAGCWIYERPAGMIWGN